MTEKNPRQHVLELEEIQARRVARLVMDNYDPRTREALAALTDAVFRDWSLACTFTPDGELDVQALIVQAGKMRLQLIREIILADRHRTQAALAIKALMKHDSRTADDLLLITNPGQSALDLELDGLIQTGGMMTVQ